MYFDGITPAYAGKSGISPGFLLSYRDHPRVCGEKRKQRCSCCVPEGSPPHVRGKERSSVAAATLEGITPACAGKRPSGAVVTGVV